VPLGSAAPDNVVVLPLAPILADSITQIFTGGSVSGVFGAENQLF
jgi:ribose-phosphate pyrophosphokinase